MPSGFVLFFFFFLIKKFFYLVVLELSCSTQDLQSSPWYAGSLVSARGI